MPYGACLIWGMFYWACLMGHALWGMHACLIGHASWGTCLIGHMPYGAHALWSMPYFRIGRSQISYDILHTQTHTQYCIGNLKQDLPVGNMKLDLLPRLTYDRKLKSPSISTTYQVAGIHTYAKDVFCPSYQRTQLNYNNNNVVSVHTSFTRSDPYPQRQLQ